MKVILADVHGPVCGKDQPSPNLSLLYLASYSRQKLKNLDFTYIPQRVSLAEHLAKVVTVSPEVYAVSFTSFSASTAYSLIKKVRELLPDVLIVAGGAHVNSHARQILDFSPVDICVVGEGEMTFTEILSNVDGIKDYQSQIPGVAFLENGSFVQTSPRELISNLDTIPFPARDLICQDDFVGISYNRAKPNTEIVTTRGCPFLCTFCANPVFREGNGPRFRSRSPENIVKEVEELYQSGYREIYFHSDEINVELDWSIQLCQKLAALNHKDLFFQTNLRATPMSDEFAFWLKKAGFWLLRLGVESANERVLIGIKKQVPLKAIEDACTVLSRNGLTVFTFLMMFNIWEENGELCHETPEEIGNTIKFVNKLKANQSIHLTSWQIATPTPGAEMYDVVCRHGLITRNFLPDEPWLPHHHFEDISRLDYKILFAKARWQTAKCAMAAGTLEWKNWRRILWKAKAMLGI